MMTTTITIAIALLGAFWASPAGQAFAARYMRRIKQERALARLRHIPEYRIGAKLLFNSPDVGGGSAQVGDVWVLADMAVGRVLLVDESGDRLFPMTCQEFEAAAPFILDAPLAGAARQKVLR